MLPFLFLELVVGCGPKRLPTATIKVKNITINVELAVDSETRSRGLMHRGTMGPDDGMLFVYPASKPRTFWMKDTKIPLSIAFLDRSGEIVKIAQMQPLSTATTKSIYPAKYALEMNRGWFKAHGIKKGDRVSAIPKDDAIEVK